MTPARRACLFALLLSAGLAAGHPAAAQTGPAVAAASDLKFALDDVAAAFRAQTGQGNPQPRLLNYLIQSK